MDKRNKHITINLTEDQFNCLLYIATQQRRKIADAAYILLTDSIDENIIKLVDIKNTGFKKMHFVNED